MQGWQFILLTGGAMCAAAGGYLLLVLRLWPRVFLRRYPEEVRSAVEPLSPVERALGFIVGLPLLAMLIGFPAGAALHMDTVWNGQAGFLTLFAGAYTVWTLFNLFDWLVLDELLIGVWRPEWLILKGAEDVPLRFDRAEHFRSFLNGSIGGALVCAVIASIFVYSAS